MHILWGLLGITTIIGLGFLLSNNKKYINPRTILLGLAMQLLFAFLVLKSSFGRKALQTLSSIVQNIVGYTNEGISFLFGSLVAGDGMIFAFQVLTVIIFFSSLISILYYLGIMQWIIRIIGGALAKLLSTSKTESLSAAANIFVGHTEAPLVVKPFLKRMTNSELFAIMVGGMASVSGAVLIGYSLLGIPLEYLLAASFMAAPSGLVMAKLVVPQTATKEEIEEVNKLVDTAGEAEEEDKPANIIDAAANGASVGMKMALEIAAMLLAFISLVALLNGGLGLVGDVLGIEGLTLEKILGIVISPIAFLVGVPWDEAVRAGQFIGQKIVINEFVAFADMGEVIDSLSEKTVIVLSFALAGFANFGSIAVQIGALGSLAPSRRNDVSRLGFRAMIAGALASLLNAAIAGMFM
ncbi:NupC/NupG family nucleoside CNT transporter [Virgibacillus halodenitrificans]|uniref:NupC/NupG family nucleoside CNT transporter n=1 Tax=Virgibacillus halodenitrificans TaxID=1482 RepID=UPI00136AC185|nr:NupC/NupG family nucleoside CNT transporter [Virgibacillus halodenitrificans]MYL47108.1 NupC/NupG family nucleoside CNT transporter [Virgibacillus halodenitrificans]